MVSPSRRRSQSPLTLSLVWVPLLGAGITCGCTSTIPLKPEQTYISTMISLTPQPLSPTAEPLSSSSSQLLQEAIKPIGHFFSPPLSAVINGLINTHDIQFPPLCMSSLRCRGLAASSAVSGGGKGLAGSCWELEAAHLARISSEAGKFSSLPSSSGVPNTFQSLLCFCTGLFAVRRLSQPSLAVSTHGPLLFTPNDFPVF